MSERNEDYMGYTPGNFEIKMLPAGTYDYVIHGIIGLGMHTRVFKNSKTGKDEPKSSAQIKVIFEIPKYKREEDSKTELLSATFPISSHPNSNYYKFCNTLFEGFNEELAKKLVLASGMKTLLGKVGTLKVVNWESKEGRSVDLNSFSSLHPDLKTPEPTRDFVFFNPFNPDLKVFEEIVTARTRKKIMEADNANEYPDELHKLYARIQRDYEENKQNKSSTSREETAPWEGSTDAIQ